MKKNCIPRPAYYCAVVIVIVVVVILTTVLQGCAVYGLSYVHGRPVEARGGYTSRDAYLAGYEPYPVIVTGGYYPPYYFGTSIDMPGTLQEGVDYFTNGDRPLLVIFTNQTGQQMICDLFYQTDKGIVPVATKDGKPWNRIILAPQGRLYYHLLPGKLVYKMYKYIGPGKADYETQPSEANDLIWVSHDYLKWGFHHMVSVFGK